MSAVNSSDATPGRTLSWVFAALCVAGFGAGLSLIGDIGLGNAASWSVEWLPALDVAFAFRIDGLALLFVLLVSGIGALIFVYTAAYFKGDPRLVRLQWQLAAFTVAMLGLVTADDVIALFVFWELTTVTSFLLVGFDHENRKARRAALQALLVTGAGGLALLAGLLLLADVAGTTSLSGIVAAGAVPADDLRLPWILTLVLLGAFTKSAQFPFHFWLPGAMSAPSPVSAFLHSATMVKAGIYLMARLQPVLADNDAWFYTLTIVGAITAVWASLMALRQTDIKLMLAWTTVMALGTLTLFLGSTERIAVLAAMTFLIVHAFYKCALFLVIGNVDHGTGTRELGRLGSLARALPFTAVVAIAASFSMAGFPPFLGFIGKELKYEGALAIADEPFFIAAASLSANAMMVAIALTIVWRVFLSGSRDTPVEPHEAPITMWAPPMVLAVLGLAAGIFPEYIAGSLIEPATASVLDRPTEVKLSLWHGINLPLMMSVATVLIGLALFLLWGRVSRGLNRLVDALPFTGDGNWDGVLDGIVGLARGTVNRIQTGRLGHYLMLVFASFVILAGLALLAADPVGQAPLDAPPPFAVVTVAVMLVGIGVVTVARSRLLSVAALGLVGSGVAMVFLLFGAIDVAITQLMVETLFVVLIAALLPRLPRLGGDDHHNRTTRIVHGVLAIGTGSVVALATWYAAGTAPELVVSQYYEANSLVKAYGANIVNVILVDFRALDTLGEVAVVVTAALAVMAAVRGLHVAAAPKPPADDRTPVGHSGGSAGGSSPVVPETRS